MAVSEVGDISDQLSGVLANPGLLVGIPLALLGAVFMSFGAQYQHRGVSKVERLAASGRSGGLGVGQLIELARRPSWLLGTGMLVLAVVCQLGALSRAPLIVVQPLGAVALVITTLLNARMSGVRPTRRSLTAIGACFGGILAFVTIAAFYAIDAPITDRQLITILLLLAAVTVVVTGLWFWLHARVGALFSITAAGIMFGFVATLAKVVISRIQSGDFEWLTLICLVALAVATAIGSYFVQTAHSSGPPDLVIAGLTVIDPLVAIVIGLTVLGEADNAPLWVYFGFGVTGLVAVWGVFQLARHHPQVVGDNLQPSVSAERADVPKARSRAGSARLAQAVDKVWPDPPVHDRDQDMT